MVQIPTVYIYPLVVVLSRGAGEEMGTAPLSRSGMDPTVLGRAVRTRSLTVSDPRQVCPSRAHVVSALYVLLTQAGSREKNT